MEQYINIKSQATFRTVMGEFEEESGRSFTRELTRSSVEVLCCKC